MKLKNLFIFGLVFMFLVSSLSMVSADLTNDLVSYWTFDNTLKDAVGTNDATNNGATYTVDGKIGGGYSFDGSNDYIAMGDVLDDVIVGSSAKFTVSSWVKKSGDGMFIGKYADTQHSENGRQLLIRFASSKIDVLYHGGIAGTGGYEIYSTSNTYSNSVWYNVVIVVDMTQSLGNRVIIYVNGVEQTTTVTTVGTPAGMQAGPAQFAVGGAVSSTGVLKYQINAIVDEPAIWNRVLTSAEITELYNSGEGLQYPFGSKKFTITAQDIYTNTSITNFSVDIDGQIYFSNNTGSVITHILTNDTSLYNFEVYNATGYFDRTFNNINVSEDYVASLYPAFEVSVYNEYTNATFNTFNLTLGNTTYNTTTGLISISDLDDPLGEYSFNISGDFFTLNYDDYNISSNLNASANQTEITFNLVFSSNELLNFSDVLIEDLNNSINYTISTGTLNFNPSAENITFRFSNADNIFNTFNSTFNFIIRENATYNITLSENQNILTFNDVNSSTPLDNVNITITYPSGSSIDLMTNSSGQINFSYIFNNSLEFGDYTIHAVKLGYLNFTTTETITNADVPFFKTYNLSRAIIIINVFDRQTGALLTGTDVSLNFFGLFNETTNTGQLIKDNLTVASRDYTVYALADGYFTEVRRFTYNNQEEIEIDFYMLNLTQDNAANLFVTTKDSFFRFLQDSAVELLEYSTADLSYIVVSECLTNVNGECAFGIELNTKTYYIRASKIVGGKLLSAETSQSGEIIVTNNEVRNLILYETDTFTINKADNLIYSISETFVSNISQITVDFRTYDGLKETVCVEYFRKDSNNWISVTGDTYCVTTTGSLQNINTYVGLNRSNEYKAEVYIKNDDYNVILRTFIYPSISSTEEILTPDIIGAIIVVAWLMTLALALYMKNITLWFVLAIFLSWAEVLFFPSFSIVAISVFKTIISLMTIMVSRKQRDNV